MIFCENALDELRRKIISDPEISEKRTRHILAVEDMAIRLGKIYVPEKLYILRAAALLHDVTKEYTAEKQIEICRRYGHEPTLSEILSPKLFHAMTAAYLIPDEYPEFNDPEVVSAVRWHTTGKCGMSICEKLIYLADYIDESRTFPDCVTLRNMFFGADIEKMTEKEKVLHLNEVMIASYQMTVTSLVEDGKLISTDTVDALNELICLKKAKNSK